MQSDKSHNASPLKRKSSKVFYFLEKKCVFAKTNPDKLDERGCIGAPDLIVEIVEESSAKRDLQDKFWFYAESGVREYWIVRPEEQTVTQFFAENGKYSYINTYTSDDIIAPIVL